MSKDNDNRIIKLHNNPTHLLIIPVNECTEEERIKVISSFLQTDSCQDKEPEEIITSFLHYCLLINVRLVSSMKAPSNIQG